jgi:hypothetical protein
MAHRAHIIATACQVVLDRRGRPDEEIAAEVRRRVGGTPADQAAAETWAVICLHAYEQTEAAYKDRISPVDGRALLRGWRDANRPIGVVR